MTVSSPFLRKVLFLDAVASGATGVLLAGGAGLLTGLLGLPEALMRPVGAFLVVYGLIIGWMASRPALLRPAVVAVIGVNALWVVESLAFLVLGWVQPTALGYAFVIAQALVVGVLAELQFIGLRRAARAA